VTGRRIWGRTAACAAALTAVAGLAAGCSSSGGASSVVSSTSPGSSLPTQFGAPEKTTLNVAVVPAMDSAGFFIALHDGLFAKEGLTVNYSPAVSSETAVAQQPKGQLDITGGNYVSPFNEAAVNHAPVEVVAEGSIMQQGAQPILTMPDSNIATLGQLKDRVVGVNAPGNIDYLLGVSVLQENGIPPKNVVFPPAPIPFPQMAGQLASGQISAAIADVVLQLRPVLLVRLVTAS
jgi:NitT/TauT family transport system substrate-binding protein